LTKWSTTAAGPTHRTNVCDRQRLLSSGAIPLRDALAGLDASVAITNYRTPNENRFFTLSGEGTIKAVDPGLFVVVLDEVARRAGFAWRDSFAAVDPLSPAEDANRTWSDLLEWEVTNFDIAVDYWGRSKQRMALGIAFPRGWYSGSVILATLRAPRAETFSSYWAFLLPFDGWTWVCVLAVVVFTGMCYFLLDRLDTDADEKEMKPAVAVFLSALVFTGHFQFLPNTHPARLLSFSWTFCCLILMSAYTANLASFLVSRSLVSDPVSTLDDALVTGIPVCIQRSSAMDEFVTKKYPDMNLIRKDTEQEMFLALRDSWYRGGAGCGVAVTNLNTFELYQGQSDTNWDCAMYSEKRTVFSLPSGFATAVDSGVMCTSLISYVLNLHLTEMEADGFLGRAWEDHVAKVSTQDCHSHPDSSAKTKNGGKVADNNSNNNISLNLLDMAGIFILHGFLTVVAVLFALFDLIKRYRSRPILMRQRSSSKITIPN
jgi:Ligand-gated ion channel